MPVHPLALVLRASHRGSNATLDGRVAVGAETGPAALAGGTDDANRAVPIRVRLEQPPAVAPPVPMLARPSALIRRSIPPRVLPPRPLAGIRLPIEGHAHSHPSPAVPSGDRTARIYFA